jgi:hypothetical protein
VVVGALLVAGGCASTAPKSAEFSPVQLRTASGVRAQCGMQLIPDVQRANDLTWSERLFYWWSAQRDARRAVRNEEEWRRRCVERYRQQGFEVVSAPR